MRHIDTIVIHCADTPNGHEFHASDIDQWHKERGWSGIGYHYVIPLTGDVEKGREDDVMGAHVRGHNHSSLGICMIGNDKFNLVQWVALAKLVAELNTKYDIVTVCGHRDFDSHKTCPNFDVTDWLENGIPEGKILDA